MQRVEAKMIALNLALQKERERLMEEARQKRCNIMASIITGAVRYRGVLTRVKRRLSAIKIQKRVRGIMARSLFEWLKAEARARRNAAVVIQCAFRQHLARRQVRKLKLFIYI